MDQERADRLIMELRGQVNDLLAAAQLLAGLVRRRGEKRDEENLSVLNQGLYRLVRTVNHLELCREEEIAFRPRLMDAAELCSSLGRQVEDVAGELGTAFRWELEQESALTMGDRALLEQAILNMLCNALQSAGPGGHVRLKGSRREDRYLVIVQDDGPGLHFPDPQADPLIKTAGGVGLGLEAARRAASAHGGVLMLENSEDTGVKAVLSIPLKEPEPSGRLNSPMGYDRSGGFSQFLVEMSPLLPLHFFTPGSLE